MVEIECKSTAVSRLVTTPAQGLNDGRSVGETPGDLLEGVQPPPALSALTEGVHLVGEYNRHERSPAPNRGFGEVDFNLDYIANVLRPALPLLKTPGGWVLLFYILALLASEVQDACRKVLAPICWIPSIASTPIVMCHHRAIHPSEQITPSFRSYRSLHSSSY